MQGNRSTSASVRWLQEGDIKAALQVDRESYASPWSEAHLAACFKQGSIAQVAEVDGKLAGFVIYSIVDGQCRILRLAVQANLRRRRIGKRLVSCVLEQALKLDRKRLVVLVSESNLPAQMFFRTFGLRAISTREDKTSSDRAVQRRIVMEMQLSKQSVPFDDLTKGKDYFFFLKSGSAVSGSFAGYILGKPARLRIRVNHVEKRPRSSQISSICRLSDVATPWPEYRGRA